MAEAVTLTGLAEEEGVLRELHTRLVARGCSFWEEVTGEQRTLVYSLRGIRLWGGQGEAGLWGEYDIRAFLRLYRETEDEALKKLLFEAAVPCSYCIDDKCTTFLMKEARTIGLGAETKRLCGPYRHGLRVTIGKQTLAAGLKILDMMLEYTAPAMHRSAPNDDRITYEIKKEKGCWLVGYPLKHSPLSPSDEDFAASLLHKGQGESKAGALARALGQSPEGPFVGAVDNFVNGASYDFLFGVLVEKKPGSLPQGAAARKIGGGAWAVYNSTAGDYPGIWQQFTQAFYGQERMGYDPARIPFERYREDGSFFDVHIPVDPELPPESGMTRQLVYIPDIPLAGYGNYAETDHPLYKDRRFPEFEGMLAHAALQAPYVARVSVHAHLGKPLFTFEGCPVDRLSELPPGLERYTLEGGWWRMQGWKHFTGEYQGWGEAFDFHPQTRVPLWDVAHPRGFNQYVYPCRGGYSEIGLPARLPGKRCFAAVTLPGRRLVGVGEDLPRTSVTREQIEALAYRAENREPGSWWAAFTGRNGDEEEGTDRFYYDIPLFHGFPLEEGSPLPEGLEELVIERGRYVRVSEDRPNGPLGWGSGITEVEAETGLVPDYARPFLYREWDEGRRHVFYIPVKEKQKE